MNGFGRQIQHLLHLNAIITQNEKGFVYLSNTSTKFRTYLRMAGNSFGMCLLLYLFFCFDDKYIKLIWNLFYAKYLFHIEIWLWNIEIIWKDRFIFAIFMFGAVILAQVVIALVT